ncbi:MAG: DUF4340 domain-containing protein [Gammaproteobacteria bacterium]|nr:DUF4340 domain-containing protein [Gammaproteobacteria bacterium]
MPEAEKTDKPESAVGQVASGLRQRWLLNAGLLALIAALGWIVTQRMSQQQVAPSPPLTSLPAVAVAHVRIERPEQPEIVLEKPGAAWRLTAPIPARANNLNVENLLRVLAAPAETRFPAVPTQLAQYGLEKPLARVRLENEEIAFGALHPLKNQIYVLHNNEVVLIPGYLLSDAAAPYTRFIDSHLFEDNRKLGSLQLPGFSVSLKDGVWRRQPADKKLTSDQSNDFASEWQNASALSVEKYSGKEAVDHIDIIGTRDGKSEKMRLGILAYKPDFVLYRPDENLEYHFTEETGKRLLNLSGQ